MADDVIQIILAKLDRIEAKQDTQVAQWAGLAERLAAIEAKQAQQERINEKVNSLEETADKANGAKSATGWIVATAVSVAAVFVEYFRHG